MYKLFLENKLDEKVDEFSFMLIFFTSIFSSI